MYSPHAPKRRASAAESHLLEAVPAAVTKAKATSDVSIIESLGDDGLSLIVKAVARYDNPSRAVAPLMIALGKYGRQDSAYALWKSAYDGAGFPTASAPESLLAEASAGARLAFWRDEFVKRCQEMTQGMCALRSAATGQDLRFDTRDSWMLSHKPFVVAAVGACPRLFDQLPAGATDVHRGTPDNTQLRGRSGPKHVLPLRQDPDVLLAAIRGGYDFGGQPLTGAHDNHDADTLGFIPNDCDFALKLVQAWREPSSLSILFSRMPESLLNESPNVAAEAMKRRFDPRSFICAQSQRAFLMEKEYLLALILLQPNSVATLPLSDTMKGDPDIVLAAMNTGKMNPWRVSEDAWHISEDAQKRLLDNRHFFLSLMMEPSLPWTLLSSATAKVRSTKRIIYAAAKKSTLSFYYADESLKKNKGFVLQVLKVSHECYEFVHPSLKCDPEVRTAGRSPEAKKRVAEEERAERKLYLPAGDLEEDGSCTWDAQMQRGVRGGANRGVIGHFGNPRP